MVSYARTLGDYQAIGFNDHSLCMGVVSTGWQRALQKYERVHPLVGEAVIVSGDWDWWH